MWSIALAGIPALLLASVAGAAPNAPSTEVKPEKVLTSLFSAIGSEDHAALEQLTTTDFRVFENGRMFDRASFLSLVHQMHASGKHFQWSVTDARVAEDGKLAVIDYVNRGMISDGSQQQPMSWLEVASFRLTSTGWKVAFLSSQRVASTTAHA